MPVKENDPGSIVAARCTPLGAFMGAFAETPATELGAAAIHATLSDAALEGADVSEVLMGCVLPAGLGQAPARHEFLGGALPLESY